MWSLAWGTWSDITTKKLKLWPLPIHKSFFKTVLSWFISVAMIKYPNKRQLKREKVYLSSLFLGSQGGRNVKPYSHTQKHREVKSLSARLLACVLRAVSPLTPLRLLDQKWCWCAPAGWIKTLPRDPLIRQRLFPGDSRLCPVNSCKGLHWLGSGPWLPHWQRRVLGSFPAAPHCPHCWAHGLYWTHLLMDLSTSPQPDSRSYKLVFKYTCS